MAEMDPTADRQPRPERHVRAAVDMLELGILVVERDGQITFANRTAQTLLGNPEGENASTGGRLPDSIARLPVSVRAAIGRAGSAVEPSWVRTRARAVPLTIFIVPVRGDGHDAVSARIVWVGASPGSSGPGVGAAAKLYGLTGTETRLLDALLKGKRVSQYAHQAGITLNTAKGYLKQLFRKTRTSRQSDLIRVLLADPVLRLVSVSERR